MPMKTLKENYSPPMVTIIHIEPCEIFTTSNMLGAHNIKGDEEEDFARNRRGRWGNLWD